MSLFVRISATDWVEGGWMLEDSVRLSRYLKELGVDLVDCSSGGTSPDAKIPVEPSYQAPFAAEIRRETGIATGAVGLITEPEQAEEIIAGEEADAILPACELLRDPYWPLRAAHELGADVSWPSQYQGPIHARASGVWSFHDTARSRASLYTLRRISQVRRI